MGTHPCEDSDMRQELGKEHSITLRAKCTLGQIFMDQGLFGEAEKLLREVLEAQRSKHGDENDKIHESINALAVVLTKREK